MPTSAPRTLAEQLRGWGDDQLGALLTARPDVLVPVPADCAQLASRLGTRFSVARALDACTLPELAVLDAVVAHDARLDLGRLREVVHASAEAVDEAVAALHARALLWGLGADALVGGRPTAEAVVKTVTAVADLLGTSVSGLATGQRLADSLAERGGTTTTRRVDVPPEIPSSRVMARLVDSAATGAALELVQHVEHLLERWGLTPPRVLRSGGLAVRDTRAGAAELRVDEIVFGVVVETAEASGLIAQGLDADGELAWLPTDAYDAWLGSDLASRWARLAAAWLASTRLRGALGPDRKPVNVLAPGLERSWLPDTRRATLALVAALPPGVGLAGTDGVEGVVDRLRWERPRRPPERADAVAATLTEAGTLGVVASGVLSAWGRALLEAAEEPDGGAAAAASALAAQVPPPLDHVLLQADLTAVAPGPLTRELSQQLSAVADIDSRGAATVYRFTDSSVRRALDAGWTAAEVHDLLATASRTPVPQALTYLVDDTSRRFGTLRVGAAESFLRSEDEAALAALVHDSRARSLGLRLLAPTVVASSVPPALLLERLRELGQAPVLEARDGTVRLARPDLLRARRPPRPARQARRGPATVPVEAALTALRAGDRATAARPPGAGGVRMTPTEAVAALRSAADAEQAVWIEYVDGDGRTRELVVEPRDVDAGTLVAHDHRSDTVRTFSLHRVRHVRALPDPHDQQVSVR